jgi:hypothetical protein
MNKITIPQTGEEAFYGIPYKEPFMPIPDGYGFYGVLLHNSNNNKVQCHICGKWFEQLFPHIYKKHQYNLAADYKDDFGLLQKTALVSEKLRGKLIKNGHPKALIPFTAARIKMFIKNNHHRGNTHITQSKNSRNTCQAQLIFRLKCLAKQLGKPNISSTDVYKYDSQLTAALTREFGSFNNAKIIAGLTLNIKGSSNIYSDEAIRASLKNFYDKYHRCPRASDFRRNLLICSEGTIHYHFGTLRQACTNIGIPWDHF